MGKQTRSENTRLHLVRSAAELFDLNGFAGATVDDVSRAAGVTKGAFYFHFSSKDELSWAIQDEARLLLRAAVYRKASAGLPALQSLVDLTHELAWWLEHEPLVRASFRTARECGHRGAPFLDFHLDWLSTVETLLAAAAESGALRENVVIDDAVTLVLSTTSGIEILWWAGVRTGSIRRSLAGMWRLVLPGIAAQDHLRVLRPEGTTGFDSGARS